MSPSDSIFVQIAGYRDPELAPTLVDLYAKAAHPERIVTGICRQYGADEKATLTVKDIPAGQLRWLHVPAADSKGVCWARAQVQTLYKGEEYTLAIDSHMRFVKGWDELLIKELKKCGAAKAVISHHPPSYTPPAALAPNPRLTVLRAGTPSAGGDIRLRGEPLDSAPKAPLRGAFVAPGFWFARGAIIREIPYDPHLYFEQEELCLSARLHTHGWDVFHPTKIIAYHLYNTTPVAHKRHNHWDDHPDWSALNRIARERRDHLLGYQEAASAEALHDLDRYGHGEARSLEDYGTFCGIDFSSRTVTPRAMQAEFIPDLARYRSAAAPAAQPNPQPKSQAAADTAPRYRSAFIGMPPERFKPASFDILGDLPLGKTGSKALKPRIVDAPPGVLIIENYASPAFCKKLCAYADTVAGRKLEVVDNSKSTRDKVVTQKSGGRITDYVSINGATDIILPTFIDIHVRRLGPFFGVNFEWFERPQILRYTAGGKYDPHADAEHLDQASGEWRRSQDRDVSVLLYLNEEYGGGEIAFPNFNFEVKPKTGMLLGFLSDHRYLHAARPTTSGLRYVIVSWAAATGTPRVQARAPYASVFLEIPA